MNNRNHFLVVLLLLFLLVVGCKTELKNVDQPNSTNTIAPSTNFAVTQNSETAYPLTVPKDTPQYSAYDGLQIATEFSKKWNKQAFLFSIPNTAAMERNLGYPMTGLGWFYLFRNPDNPLELFVYVDNGIIQGNTEAEVAPLIEVSEKSYAPLDTSGLLDSDQITEIINKNHKDAEKLNYQYELQLDEKLTIPVWSIYEFNDGILGSLPIMRINAANGQIIN